MLRLKQEALLGGAGLDTLSLSGVGLRFIDANALLGVPMLLNLNLSNNALNYIPASVFGNLTLMTSLGAFLRTCVILQHVRLYLCSVLYIS